MRELFILIGILLGTLVNSQSPISIKVKKNVKTPRQKEKFGVDFSNREGLGYMDFNKVGLKSQIMDEEDPVTFNIDLINDQDLSYTGPVYVGTPMAEGYVIYDTGSGDFTITSSSCTNCVSDVYDPLDSSTSVDLDQSGTLMYGSAVLQGEYYQDSVCLLPPSDCVTNFEIFAITNQQGLDVDGILGLSPEFTNASSIVYTLYDQEIISQLIVGILIADVDQQSEIMFGGYDSQYITSEPVYFPLISTNWWHIAMSAGDYNGQSFMSSFATAIIDTGTSFIVVPYNDFITLAELISNDDALLCDEGICVYFKQCSKIYKKLNNIEFKFTDDQIFTLTPQQYLIDGSVFDQSGLCYLGIEGANTGGLYIMGDTFLRYYYSIYDYGNQQVGLAPNIYNSATLLLLGLGIVAVNLILI